MPGEDITTKYRLDISDFEKNIKEANQALKLHNAQFKATTAGMDDWSSTSEGLEAKVKQLNGVLTEQKKKLEAYNQELGETKKSQKENAARADQMRQKYRQVAQQYGENAQETKKYKTALTEIEKEEEKSAKKADALRVTILNQQAAIGRTERDLKQFTQALDNLEENLSEAGKEAESTKDSISGMEGGFTVVKGAIAGLLKDGITALVQGFRDFATEGEDAMSRFQASVGATDAEMEQYKKNMNDLYKNDYGESMNDVADAMGKVKQQMNETDPSKLKEMTKNAMTLSDTFDADLNETVRGANSLMMQYSMTGQEAFDLIAKGSQEGLNYTDELGDNLAEYAGKFQQAGYSATEYFQLLKNGTQNGAYNLDKVNDAINEVTTRLADGTIADNLKLYSKDTQKLFKEWQQGGATQKEVIESIVEDIKNCKNEQEAMNMAAEAFGTMAEDGSLKFITSLSSVGTTFSNVKGSMEQVDAVRYDNAKSQLETLGRTLKTDILQPIAMEILPGLNNFLGWFVSNVPIILGLLSALGAGFAVFKIGVTITTLTGGIAGLGTALSNLVLIVKGLGIVMATTPVGWITAIAGAVAGIAVYTATTKKATSATDKQIEAIKKEVAAHDELTKSIEEHKTNRQENIKSTEEEGVKADYLYKRLMKLMDVQKKDAGQKAQIKSVVDQLNAVMPDLNLHYDEEKDKLNQSTDAIKANIAAQKDLILAKAAQENMESVAGDIASKEAEQVRLVEAQTEAKKKLSKAEKDLEQARAKQEKAVGLISYAKATKEVEKQKEKVDGLKKSYKDAKTAISENKTELKKLNQEYNNTEKYANQKINSGQIEQELNTITQKCKKKGIEIPKAISEGIRSGQYQVPKSVEGMQNLIDFAKLSKKAKLDGVKIPKNLAQGISSGKISAQQAVKALEKVTQFDENEIVKKAKKNGIKIPKGLRDGIASGKTSVKAATKQVEKVVEKELSNPKTKAKGKKAAKEYKTGLTSEKGATKAGGKEISKAGKSGMESVKTESSGEKSGKGFNKGVENKKEEAKTKGEGLGKNAKSGAESVKTESSGQNFGQGFINGIGNMLGNAFTAGWNFVKRALSGAKEAQKEGSPSKITFQSGVWFGQGYINGIVSKEKEAAGVGAGIARTTIQSLDYQMKTYSSKIVSYTSGKKFTQGLVKGIADQEKDVVRTTKNLVGSVIKEMLKLDDFNFSDTAQTATESFTKQIEEKITFMNDKITYQNEQKVNSFDSQISKLESKKKAEEKKLKNSSKLADKIDDLKDKKRKTKNKKKQKEIQKEIDKYQKKLDEKIKKSNNKYNQLIKNQEKYKDAYQEASSKMLEEFQSAMNEYQSAAEELITDTINGITDTYQTKYDALIEKQNTLISKLQGAGELFEVSSAGVMTINDIKAQTSDIKQYMEKLKQIKGLVSDELFEQIATYDMDQGSAFMDQLLTMSKEDLKAYDEAYKEKMQLSESLAKDLYQNDFTNLQTDYANEVKKAFADLPAQLEELGKQSMKGFLDGFGLNTGYLSKEIQNIAAGIITNFKNELGIHSPSVEFGELGEFSAVGYVKKWVAKIKELKNDMVGAIPMRQIGEAGGQIPKGGDVLNNSTTNTKVVNQNFTQNNYSPKPLSPLEVYRQTHNALSYAKG